MATFSVSVVQRGGTHGFLDILGKLHSVQFVQNTWDGNFEWSKILTITIFLIGQVHFGDSVALLPMSIFDRESCRPTPILPFNDCYSNSITHKSAGRTKISEFSIQTAHVFYLFGPAFK